MNPRFYPVTPSNLNMPAPSVISAPEYVTLDTLVRNYRIVLDRQSFRLYSTQQTDSFFVTLCKLLRQYRKKAIAFSETLQELNALASKNSNEQACVLAREAGLRWFNQMTQQGLLDVEPPIPVPEGRSYVPSDAAHLLRMGNVLTHSRYAAQPTAYLTRDPMVAEDISTLMDLNTIRNAIRTGAMQPIHIFILKPNDVILPYQRGAAQPVPSVAPASPVRPAPAKTFPRQHTASPMRTVQAPAPAPAPRGPVLTNIPDETLPVPDDIREGSVLHAGSGTITLAALMGQGNEASVYHVKEDSSVVAKVFSQLTKRKAEKLRLLCSQQIPHLVMPTKVLTADSGETVGYLMPKITNGISLADAFDEHVRRNNHLDAYFDRRQFVNVAVNLTSILRHAAGKGLIPTDLNPENILLLPDMDGYLCGDMVMIDVDSYQVDSSRFGGKGVIPGDGYTEEYWPPIPMMDSQTILTEADLVYMLGELAFKVCHCGVHPFAAKPDARFEYRSLAALSRQGMFGYDTDDIPGTTAQPMQEWTTLWSYTEPGAQRLFAELFCANSPRRTAGDRPSLQELCQAMAQYHRWLNTRGVDSMAWSVHPESQKEAQQAQPSASQPAPQAEPDLSGIERLQQTLGNVFLGDNVSLKRRKRKQP